MSEVLVEKTSAFDYLLANLDMYREFRVQFECDPADEEVVVVSVTYDGEPVDRFESFPFVALVLVSYFADSPLAPLAAGLIKGMEESWQKELQSRRAEGKVL